MIKIEKNTSATQAKCGLNLLEICFVAAFCNCSKKQSLFNDATNNDCLILLCSLSQTGYYCYLLAYSKLVQNTSLTFSTIEC